ncbi:phosphatase PAP2 family protein [Leeuwenhoekiella polynyae]|uniref:PAP2 superfamily protein n=1 Tax=Leeuwenhoekiella polynyae TaxID=1550906 RepID=A0A4V1KRV7_9FLAO|nr:phosphatase PAP2 family protein [Leeuwenhoekiella polynyae]RXG26254.1 PAP2 superfamily protein [Leeuwenhoekiella polynyae]
MLTRIPFKLTIILGVLLLVSCEKDLPTYLEFQTYSYSGIDENGGTWKPILIDQPENVEIDIAANSSDASYQTELADLKENMSKMTAADEEAIQYWGNNPVIRWNEIALELIAKYNLIPGPNDDGSYTLPSPGEPDGPPAFPFAHPPYASRALAYLSVAQFDALITAWHYKYTYNRKSPYQQDASIPYAYEPTTIPSYPSEGAVLARVSRKILTAMFPLEADHLLELEAAHLKSLSQTGGYVNSDLTAGLSIGDQIAEAALRRAATDGMKKAQTSKAVSDSIKLAAFNRFGWQWDNLELPARPVGLTPLFGQVKMWNVERVEDTRPVAPPAIGSELYLKDVKILKDHARNMTEEKRRIANFWQDGLGTYTPPGHWNRFANEFIVKYKMNPLRSARTLAYLNMAIMDAGISCWDAKYYYHYPRPIQTIAGFKTIAGTPNFPSYTSGHSVFSAAGAEVLAYIFPEEASLVKGWAEEAAISRVYGGIHWTFDAEVGTTQGIEVAKYTLYRAAADGAER